MRIARHPGYLILTVFALILTGVTAINIAIVQRPLFPLFAVLAALAVYVMIRTYRTDVHAQPATVRTWHALGTESLAVFGGAVLTYALHCNTPLDVVLSTGLVGTLVALFFKRVQVPAYCGAFVGMSSPLLLGWGPFLLAAVLAALIFVIVKDTYNGFGGKLGTIAFAGAFVAGMVLRSPFLEGNRFTVVESLWVIGVSIVSALMTYWVNIRLRQGPVLASAFVGLYLGALLILLPALPSALPVVAMGATFVGMSSYERLPGAMIVAMAGGLFGLLFIFSAPYFNGAGGKLGTMAFISTLALAGLNLTAKSAWQRLKTTS
ncbi:MAG: hypothetical protein EA374_05705 [Acholeplasmatales bacterium]|nr:MAG: hypothetical protein EA374_05705 [Acholeplasmatales bacterium]